MPKIAIVDNNREFISNLKSALISNPEYEPDMNLVAFLSGKELLHDDVDRYQLFILDIMNEPDGFETAKEIRKRNENAVLAFCSANVMPRPEYFEVEPYRYIMKESDAVKMEKNLTDLLREMKEREINCYIEVAGDGRAWRVKKQDIIYIARHNKGSIFVVSDQGRGIEHYGGEIMSNERLEDWYTQLKDDGFERAHNSYIVNLRRIIGIVKDDIVLSNGSVLRVSRTYKQRLNEEFSHYFTKKYRRGRKE